MKRGQFTAIQVADWFSIVVLAIVLLIAFLLVKPPGGEEETGTFFAGYYSESAWWHTTWKQFDYNSFLREDTNGHSRLQMLDKSFSSESETKKQMLASYDHFLSNHAKIDAHRFVWKSPSGGGCLYMSTQRTNEEINECERVQKSCFSETGELRSLCGKGVIIPHDNLVFDVQDGKLVPVYLYGRIS